MGLTKKTVAELEKDLEHLAIERQALKERTAQVMAERNKRIEEEHLDYWGLSKKQYAQAKERSRSASLPLHVCLNEARKEANRKMREAQTAMAEVAQVGVAAKGV